jgi:hypothetical protein
MPLSRFATTRSSSTDSRLSSWRGRTTLEMNCSVQFNQPYQPSFVIHRFLFLFTAAR